MKNKIFLTLIFLLALAGCGKREISTSYVTSKDANTWVGDESKQFQVLGVNVLNEKISKNELLLPSSPRANRFLSSNLSQNVAFSNRSKGTSFLTVGLPISLLKEQYLFGGVITSVSDTKNEDLGMLKLTDLEPLHGTLELVKNENNEFGVLLQACVRDCVETTQKKNLIVFPVIAVDPKNNTLILDFSTLGSGLNLVSILDPSGFYTGLKTKESSTVLVDYGYSTLVFDVEAKMESALGFSLEPVVFNTRWYLKLDSFSVPGFTTREAAKGVGFFMTARSKTPKVQRFPLPTQTRKVKYYIKNVPEAYRAAFAGAFDAWNDEFKKVVGGSLFEYEFVEDKDPNSKRYVTGDIRYNVIEWDLFNDAPYGGLGPSIAHQYTGQTISANVLVQGPRIIEIYGQWFKVGQQALELRREGREAEAVGVLKRFQAKVDRAFSKKRPRFEMSVEGLSMRIHGQEEALEDPLMSKEEFEEIPVGYTFQKYMDGYFHELVAHELGHNIGLRHNFKGNLGAEEDKDIVSSSVMEYLGRTFRHKNKIGAYDTMAIQWGYAGLTPKETDWFCTDEEVVDNARGRGSKSPECSRDDATSDPFGHYEATLEKSVHYVVGVGSKELSGWTPTEVSNYVVKATRGLATYALYAPQSADTWKAFFKKEHRPKDKAKVQGYVLGVVHDLLCNSELAQAIQLKETDEVKKETVTRLTQLRSQVQQVVAQYGLALPAFDKCE